MLEIQNITKKYTTESFEQVALNSVSMKFRDQEFVSILGQSGSGKTTLLNIIGGLDKYDSGDLIINGVSTKEYNDRDWDTYRNHSIGFVFQSYNLIGHQSILSNVEMALALSGVKKAERRKKAIEALKIVGLGDHINKKPNQLSGGQMQRVAIARAIINDPDIILADEPTGALDSETSVQIMELLKKIAQKKLVIMVTHNPELAEKYSTRIIRVKDGKILGDTNPYDGELEQKGEKPKKKTSMNLMTAMSLSFNNLKTKKGRTLLTSFAGSIGIIGIALILAISTGVNNYINSVQEETLASYPIAIQQESQDMTAMMATMMGIQTGTDEKKDEQTDEVYANPIMYRMMDSMLNSEMNQNNMKGLKTFLESKKADLNEITNAVQYGYDINMNVFVKDKEDEYQKADFMDIINNVMGQETGMFMSSMSGMIENMKNLKIWQELITDPKTGEISNLITDQYDLIYGEWPKNKEDLLLVVTPNNEISDLTLYSLGLVDKSAMTKATMNAFTGKDDDSYKENIGKHWSYEEICNIPLKMIVPSDHYRYDETKGLWVDISDNKALMETVIDDGIELKIKGIVRPKEDSKAATLSGSLCYTNELTKYYIEKNNESKFVQDQTKNTEKNLITGLPFTAQEEPANLNKAEAFKQYASELTDKEKAEIYQDILSNPDEEKVDEVLEEVMSKYEDQSAAEIVKDIKDNYASQIGYSPELIESMLSAYTKEDLMVLLEDTAREMIVKSYEKQAEEQINAIKQIPNEEELENAEGIILNELYTEIAEFEGVQKEIATKQVNTEYVIHEWSSRTGMPEKEVAKYLSRINNEQRNEIFTTVLSENASAIFAEHPEMGTEASNLKKIAASFDEFLENAEDKDLTYYYEHNMPEKISDKTHKDLLKSIGVCTLENPSFINIYPKNFEQKEIVADMIEEYNNSVSEEDKIEYTDYMAMIMSSVSTIIQAISIVLIGFVSISLIVSSIMIGIITYISVLERTKEIGILRAVGASKLDIARVFNAETVIVGFLAGLFGVLFTDIVCIPLNIIARDITGIPTLTAILPWYGYLLIILSMLLTFIAGIAPAMMAAKKDPVIALRTE